MAYISGGQGRELGEEGRKEVKMRKEGIAVTKRRRRKKRKQAGESDLREWKEDE